MRTTSLIIVVALALPFALPAAGAVAQALPSPFEDVPPWHWAFDAVRELAEKGIVQGYPRNERDLALNAVVQVYEAFAHAAQPSARIWAEAFLTNLPSDWPRALEQSRVTGYTMHDRQLRLDATRGTITLLAVVNLRGAPSISGRVSAAVVKDETGRWRVDYATLAAAQPQVFR